MQFEFKPDEWLGILHNYPVLWILFGGLLGGSAVTQLLKMTLLAIVDTTRIRLYTYRAVMYWLATVFTGFLTFYLWRSALPTGAYGLERMSSIIIGLSSPYAYRFVKALVGWKFPGFANRWGDNGAMNWKK